MRWRLPGLLILAGFSFAFCLRAEQPVETFRLGSCLAISHPCLACSSNELANLRAAWASAEHPGHAVVAARIQRAKKALINAIVFPPRGGRHTPWYQCQKCQIGLRTVDETHHECPVCGKVYSGAPYDDVLFTGKHHANLAAMTDLAWAWAITGRREFAARAAEYLKGYALRYLSYPFHGNARYNLPYNFITGGRLFGQTLEEACAIAVSIAPTYDLIHDSDVLSDQDHELIRERLIRPMLKNIKGNFLNSGNWHCWHNAALFWGGVLLHENEWIERALKGKPNGFQDQMKKFVTPDGMWFEGSWGYHFYALQALVILAEGARRFGVDLWSDFRLRAMFTFPVDCVLDGDTLPRFGDDTGCNLSQQGVLMEAAWNSLRERAVIPFLPEKPIWETVLYGRPLRKPVVNAVASNSGIYPLSGYAILRSAGPKKLSSAVTFGPHGGYHAHFDKLSFVLYGFGCELAVDPGRAASQSYQLPIHKKWYRGTISHNTVLVDGKPQAPATGRAEYFQQTGGVAFVSLRCNEAYSGVNHRRLLALMPERLVVADYLSSTETHCFDWLYHGAGTAVLHTAAAQLQSVALEHSGAEFMRGVRKTRTDRPIEVDFKINDVIARLIMAAAPDTGCVLAEGPFRSVQNLIPMIMVSRTGREALFAAVIEPVRAGETPVTAGIEAVRSESKCVIEIKDVSGREANLEWDIVFGRINFDAVNDRQADFFRE